MEPGFFFSEKLSARRPNYDFQETDSRLDVSRLLIDGKCLERGIGKFCPCRAVGNLAAPLKYSRPFLKEFRMFSRSIRPHSKAVSRCSHRVRDTITNSPPNLHLFCGGVCP